MYNEKHIITSTQGHPVAEESSTLLSRIVGVVATHNVQINKLTLELNRTIDRLIGALPPSPTDEKKDTCQANSGVVYEFEGQLYDQEMLIGKLETAIMRLSVL